MAKSHLPLNALRAFEAAARHLSFTKAGLELRVTQAAVSHLVKSLEGTLGVRLFRRVPRGLALTEEGQALVPVVADAFARLRTAMNTFEQGHIREAVIVGAVGTFANGWLLPRAQEFRKSHPHIDLRLLINNNRVDIAGEGLDWAIRFGDGSWHGTEATHLMAAPLSPVCSPKTAKRLRKPEALASFCCAPIATTNGAAGSPPPEFPARPSRGRSTTLQSPWPMPQRAISGLRCCRSACFPAILVRSDWCSPSTSRLPQAITG
jgi:LysR family transcriptional regulator of beta-lactamase